MWAQADMLMCCLQRAGLGPLGNCLSPVTGRHAGGLASLGLAVTSSTAEHRGMLISGHRDSGQLLLLVTVRAARLSFRCSELAAVLLQSPCSVVTGTDFCASQSGIKSYHMVVPKQALHGQHRAQCGGWIS